MVPSPHMGSSTKAPTYKNKGAVTHWARHTPPSVQSLLSHVLISHLLLSCTESNADNKSLLYQAKLAGKTISYKAWIALTNTMHLVLRSHIGKIHDWTADRYWLQINLWITVASVFLAKTRTSALTLQQWKKPLQCKHICTRSNTVLRKTWNYRAGIWLTPADSTLWARVRQPLSMWMNTQGMEITTLLQNSSFSPSKQQTTLMESSASLPWTFTYTYFSQRCHGPGNSWPQACCSDILSVCQRKPVDTKINVR